MSFQTFTLFLYILYCWENSYLFYIAIISPLQTILNLCFIPFISSKFLSRLSLEHYNNRLWWRRKIWRSKWSWKWNKHISASWNVKIIWKNITRFIASKQNKAECVIRIYMTREVCGIIRFPTKTEKICCYSLKAYIYIYIHKIY